VPLLRYDGSNNFFNIEFPAGTSRRDIKQGVYESSVIPLTGASGLDVSFTYLPDWEMFLDINSESDTIQPQSSTVFFDWISFGMQRFKTVYDVSYPVFITLNDPQSLNGRGYALNFALEANVRNNAFPEPGPMLDLESTFEANLLCDLDKRNSGVLRIIVRDAYTKSTIPNASLTFTVGDKSCPIGMTDPDGVLAQKFPVAIGGVVTFFHPDYLISTAILDTKLDEDGELVAELWRFKNIDVSLVKKKIFNCKRPPIYRIFDAPDPGPPKCFFLAGDEVSSSQPTNPLDVAAQEFFTELAETGGPEVKVTEYSIKQRDRASRDRILNIEKVTQYGIPKVYTPSSEQLPLLGL